MASLDLNRLRDTLRENGRRREARPKDPRRKVVVDRDGKIHLGDEPGLPHRRELSEVPQELFAELGDLFRSLPSAEIGPPIDLDRLDRDRLVVLAKLPWNTREVEIGSFTGFVYDITDDLLGDQYTMVVYFDGDEYQVKVVEPEIEGNYGVSNAHIFRDGRLCLRPPAGGMPTLEEAYAKSVLWANGFTTFRQTDAFPWPSH